MLTISKILTRHWACRSSSSLLGHRFLAYTIPKMARFRGREFGNLRKAVDNKLEAKKIYNQPDVTRRPPAHLWRAFAFFTGTAITTYSCASIIEYQNAKRKLQTLIDDTIAEFKRIYFGQPSMQGRIDKTLAWIMALNFVVFLLWRVPNLQPLLLRYFTSGLASKSLCSPMLLSTFSHNYFFHLVMNMYVLSSFAIGSMAFMGKEQFLAFYLTSGVFASFISLVEKSATRSMLPSLGASGSISALIGYTCSRLPDSQISIIFLPQWTFSAQSALYGIIGLEMTLLMVGMLTKYKIFDNAAHLGGLLFGMWYANNGEDLYRRWFQPRIVQLWSASRFAPKNQTPVIVYDGKKHIHTTMDKVEGGEIEDPKKVEQKRRRAIFRKYRETELQKQRERKQRILNERRSKLEEEEEDEEEE